MSIDDEIKKLEGMISNLKVKKAENQKERSHKFGALKKLQSDLEDLKGQQKAMDTASKNVDPFRDMDAANLTIDRLGGIKTEGSDSI